MALYRILTLAAVLFVATFCAALEAQNPATSVNVLDRVRQHSTSALPVERLDDGRVRIRASMHDLEARIGANGAEILSVDEAGSAQFHWALRGVGRADGVVPRLRAGVTRTDVTRASVDRGRASETFEASGDGLVHHVLVAERPDGDGDLTIELAASGARLIGATGSLSEGVDVVMADGRVLTWAYAKATDANGTALPTTMEHHEDGVLGVRIADAGARYPLTVAGTLADADWSSLAVASFDGSVDAIAAVGSRIFVGGSFTIANGGVPVRNVAVWDGNTWSPVGSGMNGAVAALAWDPASGRLYAGGRFTDAGGVPANGAAMWDGQRWSALGAGVVGSVNALLWDASSGRLFAAGDFRSAGTVSAHHVAAWDGAQWSALGGGLDGVAHAFAWDALRGHLYVGGDFSRAGSSSANGVAVWRGGAWEPLGGGTGTGVRALAWDARFNRLFAGGRFFASTQTGAANRVAVWGDGRWSALGLGLDSPVSSLAWDAVNLRLYVGGEFSAAGGNAARAIAVWADFRWSSLGSGLNRAVKALVWDAQSSRLYAGGAFSTAGGGAANRVAAWDGTGWSALGSGANASVRALLWDEARGRLYAAGDFSSMADTTANGVAVWNGSGWSGLGAGTNGPVTAMAVDPSTGRVFVGGTFSSVDGLAANNVASWDGVRWSSLGTGVGGSVNALAWDAANGRLFAGGVFTSAGGVAANSVAQWANARWAPLGTGTNGAVNAFAWDAANGRLFVAGAFTSAGGGSANRAAVWNGSAWSALGAGLGFPSVYALAWDAAGARLFAGGDFVTAGGIDAVNVAAWNGTAWSPLGSGVAGVNELAWDGVNNRLFVATADVSAAGGSPSRLMTWNGVEWSTVSGLSPTGARLSLNALHWDAENRRLFVAGMLPSEAGILRRIVQGRFVSDGSRTAQTITFASPGEQRFGAAVRLTATASSGLPVTFQSATPGVCGVHARGDLTTFSAGQCVILADQPGDARFLPAPRVSQTFAVNAVVPAPPVIGAAAPGDRAASVSFDAPASNGGAAVIRYTATSNPGGAAASAISSPITVPGLINGVAYTFTVTATNSAGTSLPSASSNAAVPNAGSQSSISIVRQDRIVIRENSGTIEVSVLANDTVSAELLEIGVLSIARAPSMGSAAVITRGTTTAADDVIAYTIPANHAGVDTLIYRLCFGAASPCVDARLTVEVVPLSASALSLSVLSDRGHRDVDLTGLRALTGARFEAHGLVVPSVSSPSLSDDPTPDTPFDNGGAWTSSRTFFANSDARRWRVFVDARSLSGGDVDVYLGLDANNDGRADSTELACAGTMSSVAETCELAVSQPANADVRYWVRVHSRSGAQTARVEVYEVPLDAPAAQRSVVATGPGAVSAGATFPIRLVWNDPALAFAEKRGGWLEVKSDANTSLGWVPIRIERTSGPAVPFSLLSGVDHRLALQALGAHEGTFIDVPPGTTSLDVYAFSNWNVDLYLSRVELPAASRAVPTVPAAPARGLATVSAVSQSPYERLSVQHPAPGRWYVTPVNASAVATNVTVRATLAGTGPQLRPGGYFNPERSGNGLFLYPAGGEWAGLWYTYLQDGTTTWYYLQAPAPGATGVWRATIFRSAWNGSRNHLTPVGEATVTPRSSSAFTFSYTLDGETGSEAYESFGGGCPTFAGAPLNVSGHWFDPAKAGTGYSVQLFPDYEFYTVFGYDAQGVPRYLVAERGGIGAATQTLTLEQNTGACPLCTRTGNPVRSTVGTLTRTFGNGTLQRIELSGAFTAGVPGRWAANDAVIPLGGLQGCPTN